MRIVRFCPTSGEKVTESPHSNATFKGSRWACQTRFLIRRPATAFLAIIGGHFLKSKTSNIIINTSLDFHENIL